MCWTTQFSFGQNSPYLHFTHEGIAQGGTARKYWRSEPNVEHKFLHVTLCCSGMSPGTGQLSVPHVRPWCCPDTLSLRNAIVSPGAARSSHVFLCFHWLWHHRHHWRGSQESKHVHPLRNHRLPGHLPHSICICKYYILSGPSWWSFRIWP